MESCSEARKDPLLGVWCETNHFGVVVVAQAAGLVVVLAAAPTQGISTDPQIWAENRKAPGLEGH